MPQEERLLVLGLALEEIERLRNDLIVEGFHPLGGQRSFILGWTVSGARNDAARVELLAELGIGRTVWILQILVAIEVVEIAEVLIEAMAMRKMFLKIAEMILAELGR
jgi:hypothetical protein